MPISGGEHHVVESPCLEQLDVEKSGYLAKEDALELHNERLCACLLLVLEPFELIGEHVLFVAGFWGVAGFGGHRIVVQVVAVVGFWCQWFDVGIGALTQIVEAAGSVRQDGWVVLDILQLKSRIFIRQYYIIKFTSRIFNIGDNGLTENVEFHRIVCTRRHRNCTTNYRDQKHKLKRNHFI